MFRSKFDQNTWTFISVWYSPSLTVCFIPYVRICQMETTNQHPQLKLQRCLPGT
jgi:hypothetical protein